MIYTVPNPEEVIMGANTLYIGTRCPNGNPYVTRNGRTFDPRPSLKVRNHSPNGFEWGYGGSGPAQLALAILLDATDNNILTAEEFYQPFKWAVVSKWPREGFAVTRATVLKWLSERLCPLPPAGPATEGGGA